MKPGIATTEFWVSLVALILVNVGGILAEGELSTIMLTVGNALIAAGYTFARSSVKKVEQAGINEQGMLMARAETANAAVESLKALRGGEE